MNLVQTPEKFRGEPKEYFHQNNYAKIHLQGSTPSSVFTIEFANYKYVTDDIRHQAQLDEIADRPGTFVFTRKENVLRDPATQDMQQNLAQTLRSTANAADAANNITGNQNAPIIPVQQGTQVASVIPQSVQMAAAVAPVTPGSNVGAANSFSNAVAAAPLQANLTLPETQMSPPVNPSTGADQPSDAVKAAKARLDALANDAAKPAA